MFKALKNLFSGKNNQDSDEKAAIASMESQLSRMLSDSIAVEARSIDSGENVITPKGAKISYLDAQALKFWDGRRTDYKVPPHYSESAFGRNVGPALNRLLKGKYLSLSSLEKNISLKTIPELKAVLADHELKTTGKKGELIARLMSNLSEYELQEIFPISVYMITPAGEEALKPYTIITVNNEHALGFSYYRLLSEREKNPNSSDEDILIKLLNQEIQNCYIAGNQEKYQSIITKSARFMQEIGETEKALECYILGFFIFTMQIKKFPQMNRGGQTYYLSSLIEQCGRSENYSLEQLIDKIRQTLEKNDPFNLANRTNINFAISSFRKSLSV